MKILVINSGSSSIKCSLFELPGPSLLARCTVERIGEGKASLVFERDGSLERRAARADTHAEALDAILKRLLEGDGRVLEGLEQISAVGHRVVHGGEKVSRSVVVDEGVLEVIRENCALAPLHNPPNLMGLEAALDRLPHAQQVAVFDTAFHATMPPQAYLYALPRELYVKHHIRRYGFHGTSHRYVAERAAQLLGRPLEECNLITLHLGNGCSAAAVRGGRSVDTSMGLTPLEGLVMGTRCGDIDPALPFVLARDLQMRPEEVNELLNRRSGLAGLSGVSNDMREVIQAAQSGDTWAERALDVFCYRIKKYIGAYWAVLGEPHAVVFTAGIGENSPPVRERACAGLEPLGLRLDEGRNLRAVGREAFISADDSPVAALVVPTNEELKIAMDTYQLCVQSAHTGGEVAP